MSMRRLVRRSVVAIAAAVALLLVYGVAVEPRLILDEERFDVTLPRLASEWDGAEVALLSDLQIGMWWANEAMARRAVERVVAAEPDLVLLGGDFVYSTDPGVATQVDTVIRLLDPLLTSEIPTFAVMGNHDHAVGAMAELTAALEAHGVTVLMNEAARVPSSHGGGTDDLYVVGLGPARPGMVDVSTALQQVPDEAARVVLMHNPTSFPEMPAGTAPIALAGHTHCGQVALPGTPRWSYLGLTDEEALVADGFAPDSYGQQGNRLFVTCGIGFSLVPMRINAPPQVVFVELVSG